MSLSQRLVLIIFITLTALYIALPGSAVFQRSVLGKQINWEWYKPPIGFPGGPTLKIPTELKQGLDLAGGVAITLKLDMSGLEVADRDTALNSAREVISRRVDLFGVSEPQIFSLVAGDEYRLVVELPGLEDPAAALELIGSTARLEFRTVTFEEATDSADPIFAGFSETDLSGSDLQRADVDFQSQTGSPVVSLQFNDSGRQKFADLTEANIDQPLAIFLDDELLTAPVVRAHITSGQAIIEGDFSTEDARQLSIQLNAGALPVPLSIESQHTIAPSLGAEDVSKSLVAGLVGIAMVILFMCLLYGKMGLIASFGLVIYGLINLALYKLIPVTLTLPGIAGFILSVGMAVDSNILIFERFKEERRENKPWDLALEHAFGRAWDSIKDANVATLITAFILFNPFAWSFLPTSGPVRGFALTLTIGIIVSLFTGIFVTRTLLRIFYRHK
jgi:preprotein translocase subunit SecD